jgi:hypothetical protein
LDEEEVSNFGSIMEMLLWRNDDIITSYGGRAIDFDWRAPARASAAASFSLDAMNGSSISAHERRWTVTLGPNHSVAPAITPSRKAWFD